MPLGTKGSEAQQSTTECKHLLSFRLLFSKRAYSQLITVRVPYDGLHVDCEQHPDKSHQTFLCTKTANDVMANFSNNE